MGAMRGPVLVPGRFHFPRAGGDDRGDLVFGMARGAKPPRDQPVDRTGIGWAPHPCGRHGVDVLPMQFVEGQPPVEVGISAFGLADPPGRGPQAQREQLELLPESAEK